MAAGSVPPPPKTLVIKLTKPTDTNTEFHTYTEWESYKALMEHLESGSCEEFAKFVDSNDILVDTCMLEPAGDMKRWAQQLGRREDKPAFMAMKYTIAPCMHDTFMDEYMRCEKTLRDTKGLDFFQLTKPTDTNTEVHTYTEWESYKALMEHLESGSCEEFAKFVDSNDILVDTCMLEPVGDMKREYRADRSGERAAAAARAAANMERRRRREGEEDPREMAAHVHINFHVPPSEVRLGRPSGAKGGGYTREKDIEWHTCPFIVLASSETERRM
ncbi:hypothetical protein TSOC_005866 [Tetrabaena socialis]|uniref:ABM domain-containing protein n=1 Tax=Tetrabaena socialis TaxID=47790 RepID=A0A2J8A5A0_9CHLO|nr:hypothetical protein TSOC_005866 [Tetrabaena socialis]|eukprot:PNH07694.1 hypothetical protein TSOC_005866 [Tetrabaena socialis]